MITPIRVYYHEEVRARVIYTVDNRMSMTFALSIFFFSTYLFIDNAFLAIIMRFNFIVYESKYPTKLLFF